MTPAAPASCMDRLYEENCQLVELDVGRGVVGQEHMRGTLVGCSVVSRSAQCEQHHQPGPHHSRLPFAAKCKTLPAACMPSQRLTTELQAMCCLHTVFALTMQQHIVDHVCKARGSVMFMCRGDPLGCEHCTCRQRRTTHLIMPTGSDKTLIRFGSHDLLRRLRAQTASASMTIPASLIPCVIQLDKGMFRRNPLTNSIPPTPTSLLCAARSSTAYIACS